MKPKIIENHVSYEVSKRLKELGFDLETIFYWKVVINATIRCSIYNYFPIKNSF